ncbi:MAG TPA: tyrosine--tRNA ligase [Candidatus Acidoferrales bacterium]|nr:tyrosine--tRNA ligase [Candidatus Acidoferrales bacterium]
MPEGRRQSVDDQLAYLRKGAVEIIPEAEFRAKLENSAKTGKPLRVYLGVDPTAPDLHLGHTVVIRKLKHFQDLGHTAIFLIGDFSAMIGDPTGQSETRPPLSREQVDANAKTYLSQVFKILDPKKTEVRYNSEWLGKLSSYEMVKLCGKYSLARMLEREDFRSRLDKNLPISVHELLYPLLTALDAVQLASDVELGATEQKFNLLVHRAIQREYGLPGQAILTMPILVGLDGAKKMSKSLGNYVGITEPPNEMFGKLMSISDDLMWSYYELVTDFAEPVIVRLKEEVRTGVLHPMDAKMQLAHNVITGFHGEAAARSAQDEFQRVFRNREAPSSMPEKRIKEDEWPNFLTPGTTTVPLARLLYSWNLANSRAEAERLIRQGAVEFNDKRIEDPAFQVALADLKHATLRVGKKSFLRLIVE